MWDIINILQFRHNVLIVYHQIMGSNKQTTPMELNKPLHQGWRSALISFVPTFTQPCRYCLLWVQKGSHDIIFDNHSFDLFIFNHQNHNHPFWIYIWKKFKIIFIMFGIMGSQWQVKKFIDLKKREI